MSSLLDDVIAGAAGTAPVALLLRQVKILASRTDAEVLQEWVTQELDGYPTDLPVPAYRGPFPLTVMAHLVSPYGRELRNFQLHPAHFPSEFQDGPLLNFLLRQPIAELETLASDDFTTMMWPRDGEVVFQLLQQRGELLLQLDDYQLVQVRCPVASTVFIRVLAAVRNKILDLALDIEKVAPAAGQPGADDQDNYRAATVITNHFHAGTSVMMGDNPTQLVLHLPALGDRAGLVKYLAAAGVPLPDLDELEAALDEDEADATASEPRQRRTRAWFAKASTTIGTGVATGVLTQVAQAFFGG